MPDLENQIVVISLEIQNIDNAKQINLIEFPIDSAFILTQ